MQASFYGGTNGKKGENIPFFIVLCLGTTGFLLNDYLIPLPFLWAISHSGK